MAFDVNFAINVIYPAMNSAYAIINLPQPPLSMPDGYALVAPILADPQRAARAMAAAHPEQQRIANVMLHEGSIFGLVAFNEAEKTALVAIRGTETIWDWLADFDAAPLPWIPDPLFGAAHMGFQLVYEHIRHSVRDLLTTKCPGATRVVVTGHSLGAAVAVLAAADIYKHFGFAFRPELYTLAGPRVADPLFREHCNAGVQVCYRIVNFMDVVPQVPLPPLYVQTGDEILIHGGFRPLDVKYAHRLTTYLIGLQKLQSQAKTPSETEVVAVPGAVSAGGADGHSAA